MKLRDAIETAKGTYKSVLTEEKESVIKDGGLYVMGTQPPRKFPDRRTAPRTRREGRAIPGASKFFLSFEDDTFVIFGGDRLRNILKTFRVSDDTPLEAPQVAKGARRGPTRRGGESTATSEGQILNFDDVLDAQRCVVYSRKRKASSGRWRRRWIRRSAATLKRFRTVMGAGGIVHEKKQKTNGDFSDA